MSNRIVSAAFEITDPGKVRWLWDSHLKPDLTLGVRAIHIANGQELARAEVLEEVLGWILDRAWGDFRLVDDLGKSGLSAEAKALLMGKLEGEKEESVMAGLAELDRDATKVSLEE